MGARSPVFCFLGRRKNRRNEGRREGEREEGNKDILNRQDNPRI